MSSTSSVSSAGLSPTCVVIGAGPGLGAALARRFARGGYSVAIVARTLSKLESIQKDIEGSLPKGSLSQILSVVADASNLSEIHNAFQKIRATLGNPSVLLFNASAFARGNILSLKVEDLERVFHGSVSAALACSQEVLPAMISAKKGTIIITGATASLRGSAGFAPFAIAKFGLRALSQSMAREFGPQGIHVAHIVLDGVFRSEIALKQYGKKEEETMEPEEMAENFWNVHQQKSSAWTQEMDLRPFTEKW